MDNQKTLTNEHRKHADGHPTTNTEASIVIPDRKEFIKKLEERTMDTLCDTQHEELTVTKDNVKQPDIYVKKSRRELEQDIRDDVTDGSSSPDLSKVVIAMIG